MFSRKLTLLISASIFFLIIIFACPIDGANHNRFQKGKDKPKPKPKPAPILNTDNLPEIDEIMKAIQLEKFLPNFYKMGIVDTRLLVRLQRMDFQMIELDWPITKDEVKKLKETVEALVVQATVTEEIKEPTELTERNKLQFGRFHVADCVQSFEYISASFGSPPPLGLRPISFSSPEDGCSLPTAILEGSESNANLDGYIWVIRRGGCSFFQKARMAKAANASVLVIVSNEDRLDPVVSGLGINPNITEKEVLSIAPLSIIALANTSWAPLQYSMRASLKLQESIAIKNGAMAQIVPVKCGAAAVCSPVTKEEKSINLEVSAGQLRLRTSTVKSFDFLSSTFGGQLPRYPLSLRLADPPNACVPDDGSQNSSSRLVEVDVDDMDGDVTAQSSGISSEDFAVIAYRGNCRFDVKARYAEKSGASLLIVVDFADSALQRLGGLAPDVGYVGIPGVIVTADAGKNLIDSLSEIDESSIIELIPSTDGELAKLWIDLAYTTFADEPEDQILQLEGLTEKYSLSSNDIKAWLRRKSDALKAKKFKSIDAK